MSRNTHTTIKEVAQEIAADEGLPYREAQQIAARWSTHRPPTAQELQDAVRTPFDPLFYYASTTSVIPGHLMRGAFEDGFYPEHRESPAEGCFPLTVTSLADAAQQAVLSMTARPAIYQGEAALIVEPYVFTGPDPLFGLWAASWSTELHDIGFRYNRVSHLGTQGWSGHVTAGPEPSAPCHLQLQHTSGYVLFNGHAPLPPDWLVATGIHPDGIAVFAGPCSGRLMPIRLDDDEVQDMLETGDILAARIPLTRTTGAAS